MKNFFHARGSRPVALLLLAHFAAFVAPSTSQAQAAAALQTFELRDWLGLEWSNELVSFHVADNLHGRKDVSLVGPEGKAVAHQWTTAEDGKKQIAFLANLPKNGRSSYQLQAGATSAKSEVLVEETADAIRLFNDKTGVAIRQKLQAGQAPIAGVFMNSGQWVGNSQLLSELPVESYQARLLERGPVFAEVLTTATFADGKNWRMRLRVIAGEPVVLVSETSDLGDKSSWRMNFHDNFAPSHVFYRQGQTAPGESNTTGKLMTWPIAAKDEAFFIVEPWLHWWERTRQFTWMGLYNQPSNDLLVLAAREPASWVDLEMRRNKTPQSPARVPIVREGDAIYADFALTGGVRKWMLAALPKTDTLQVLDGLEGRGLLRTAAPQEYLKKYSDFPLDAVKDYTLQWKGDEAGHPRLLVTPEKVARFQANYKANERTKKNILATPDRVNAGVAIEYYLGTGDKEVGRVLADDALRQVQREVDIFLAQDGQPTLGFAPHHRRGLLTAIYVADAVWSKIFTPEEREKIRAQVAFLGYTVNRADFWSPARGFGANPNMTTMVASYQAAYGALVPGHPQAAEWVGSGMKELKHQVDNWSDENGGWLEAPHYAMASYDFIIGPFLMAYNAGMNEYLYDPQMQKIAHWFAQISTPPNVNVEGIRTFPPIGNTYMNEPSGEFGILAGLWKDKDPEFAAHMQWMHQQHGAPSAPGVGGAFPALAGYRDIILDSSVEPKKPDYKSTLFPKTGVMLRNGVDDRETQLHMIAGTNHDHYDHDSGSITLWGKGRLISNDFGYNGRAPANQHSMIQTRASRGIMHVQTFTSTDQFDYVRGVDGEWHRQIAFVKDDDMMAPNYFVLRDSVQVPVPATWRMWFIAKGVTPGAGSTLVEGKDDVDTDIIFATPANLSFKTEDKSIEVYGLNEKRKYGKVTTTQTALITEVNGDDILAVVFPRLKTQKPPVVTSLADGQAVKVLHEAGTDYVFLSDVPFTYSGDGIHFHGTSGVVKVRGGKAFVASGEGGKLTAHGQTKEAEIPDGVKKLAQADGKAFMANFEDGQLIDFHNSQLAPRIHEGNPIVGNSESGRYSLVLTIPAAGGSNISYTNPIFIDPLRKYRLSIKMHAPEAVTVTIGGYGSPRQGGQQKLEDGKIWGWGIPFKGPTDNWQTLETTFGPPGSGAKHILPSSMVSLSLVFWASGPPSPIYVDDIIVEELR